MLSKQNRQDFKFSAVQRVYTWRVVDQTYVLKVKKCCVIKVDQYYVIKIDQYYVIKAFEARHKEGKLRQLTSVDF